MILLLDIGNTHVHLGVADARAVRRQGQMPTADLTHARGLDQIRRFVGSRSVTGLAWCSVVPKASRGLERRLRRLWPVPAIELTHRTVRGIRIRYPRPETIGPDRLANALAATHHYGAPSVVIDFGTAVTFDVTNAQSCYVGGIIAPGLAMMTDYLHDRTALLPRIHIRETRAVIGKSSEQAMRIGALHGYRGMIRELLGRLRTELKHPRLPVLATGGYARLICRGLPEVTRVEDRLTLEGLRLLWTSHHQPPRS